MTLLDGTVARSAYASDRRRSAYRLGGGVLEAIEAALASCADMMVAVLSPAISGGRLIGTDDVPEDDAVSVGMSRPRCSDGNGTLTHLFFSDDEFDVARAKAICNKCGLATPCLAGAIARQEVSGVWGGQLLVDGVVVAVKRGRGRPPKHPRPQLVVDEVPVPPHLVA